jgi:hypothetical protein
MHGRVPGPDFRPEGAQSNARRQARRAAILDGERPSTGPEPLNYPRSPEPEILRDVAPVLSGRGVSNLMVSIIYKRDAVSYEQIITAT